jgi:hypothetical protein
MYYKLDNEIIIADNLDLTLPQFAGAVEITEAEYQAECTPQKAWQRYMATLSDLPADKQREAMYKTLRYHLDENKDLLLDQPFYDTMTVDEMTARYMQYIGDDSDIALNCLDGKQEAKSHIRSIFV